MLNVPSRFRRGRRLGDPVDIPVDPGVRAFRGRIAAVSVRASISAGAWVGVALGLVLGAVVGALVVWFAGSVLDWQRDLAFTFGVARRLLPFGDQVGLLREIEDRWWLVIPLVALAVAGFAALVGALLGGILGAAYNRSPRHSMVVVELPASVAASADAAPSVPSGSPTTKAAGGERRSKRRAEPEPGEAAPRAAAARPARRGRVTDG